MAYDRRARKALVAQAHRWVCNKKALQVHVPQRLWLYRMLWRKRRAIDRLSQQRFAGTSLSLAGELLL